MRTSTWLRVSIVVVILVGRAAATEPYFPEFVFDQQRERNQFVVAWYSKHLAAMGEPSLWKVSRDDARSTGYRFLWLPTEGPPVAVRIMKVSDGGNLFLLQLSGNGGYEPGTVAIKKEVTLSPDQWEGLAALISQVDFWQMPTRIKRAGLDGEQLIVEGVKNGKYHVVDRWTPESGDFRKLCRQMVELSGLDVQKEWYETRHVSPALGKFAVIRTGRVAIAIRFVRHTGKGDDGSEYEWYTQEDGSADFTRMNVKTGKGEVYENYRGTISGDRRGRPEIQCGPLVIRWSPAGRDSDHLQFLRSRHHPALSMTATEWADLKLIDLNSPHLTWYFLPETR